MAGECDRADDTTITSVPRALRRAMSATHALEPGQAERAAGLDQQRAADLDHQALGPRESRGQAGVPPSGGSRALRAFRRIAPPRAFGGDDVLEPAEQGRDAVA